LKQELLVNICDELKLRKELTPQGFGVTFASCAGTLAGCTSDTLGNAAFVLVAGVTTGTTSLVGAEGAVEFGCS
jgi:hypothetical protein